MAADEKNAEDRDDAEKASPIATHSMTSSSSRPIFAFFRVRAIAEVAGEIWCPSILLPAALTSVRVERLRKGGRALIKSGVNRAGSTSPCKSKPFAKGGGRELVTRPPWMCRAPALPMPSNVNPATTVSPDNVVPMPAPNEAPPEPDFSAAKNFINRELSWLEFNRRVLEEAQDPTQPLLERVKFLGIVSSNLDEFFEIRVAGIKQQIASETSDVGPDGMSPTEIFEAIQARRARDGGATIFPLEQGDRAAPSGRTISTFVTSVN